MKFRNTIFLLFCFFSFSVLAQSSAEMVIKQIVDPKLKELDLSQEEAIKAINSNGINVSNKNEIIENQEKIIQILDKASKEKKANKLAAEKNLNVLIDSENKLTDKDIPKAPQTAKEPIEPLTKSNEEPIATLSTRYGLQLINRFGANQVSGNFDNYIIGEGDKIQINIFGKSQANLVFEVNAQGFIQPSQMPKIFVQNLTLKSAKKLLKDRFKQYYIFEEGEFDAYIYSARTLRISILGEIAKPGAYEIKASQTLLNLIHLAGGILESGSLRSIEILRNGKKVVIDFYDFIENPTISANFFLQNNDVVKVNLYENLVEIKGDVKRPMKYEVTKKEQLIDLLKMAGGILPSAYEKLIQLNTFKNGSVETEEYNLTEITSKSKIVFLKNGDEVIIKSTQLEKKPIVLINGEILYGGAYDFNSTNTLKKLLEKGQPKSTAELKYVFVSRKDNKNGDLIYPINVENMLNNSASDFTLKKEDQVMVFSKQQYVDNFKISIEGEIKKAQSIQLTYGDSISVKTMIDYGGGLTVNATKFGYIYRKNPFNFNKTDYIYLDLSEPHKKYLKSGDRLVIFNISNFDLSKSIQITGEVNKPINLIFSNSLKLQDLIKMAEGFKAFADFENISISRLEIANNNIERKLIQLSLNEKLEVSNLPDFELKPFDIIIVRPIPNMQNQEFAQVSGEVSVPGFYPVVEQKNYFTNFIENARGFTPFADVKNIILYRNKRASSVAFSPDLALKNKHNPNYDPLIYEGDEIVVNRFINSIYVSKIATYGFADTLSGDRYKEFLYDGTSNAYKFIKANTGGIKTRYSKKHIYVIQANGRIKRTASFLFFNIYPSIQPGDKIEIGLKEIKDNNKKEGGKKFDWDKTLAQILSLGSTFALIRLYTK